MSIKLEVRKKGPENIAVIVKELSAINEKLFTLHWGNRKDALKARPHPIRRLQIGKMQICLERENLE